MGVRRQAREAALQALFMADFLGQWNREAINLYFDHFAVSKTVRPYSVQLCEGVLDNQIKIDSKLTSASEHWSISRMGRVDRSILRLATYEIVFLPEIPINVAINEAIEVAKRFGSDESPHFINGVLDRVATIERPKLQVEVINQQTEESEVVLPEELLQLDDKKVI